MKAAIIPQLGAVPQYGDFPEPVPEAGETLISVEATVLEHFDRLVARGDHYSSRTHFPACPAIVGNDGVGLTPEGQRVVFGKIRAPYGAFAEKAAAGYVFPIPDGIDPGWAAAMLPAVLTSLLPLKYTAGLKKGASVWIHGATGVSGRIAVQVAKMLGAGHVTGTGRNAASLELLGTLGADEVINLQQPEDQLRAAFMRSQARNNFDIVLDFLWGAPAEQLIQTFIPATVGFAEKEIVYLQIGQMAGTHLSLPAAALRTSGLKIMGMGSIAPEDFTREIDGLWTPIAQDRFYMEIEQWPLSAIAAAWQQTDLHGKRIVIRP